MTSLPLQIDTVDGKAMERAMRIYNGKPMINSVNGKQVSMDEVFPLIRKYGGVVVGLTIDERDPKVQKVVCVLQVRSSTKQPNTESTRKIS